MATPIDNPGTNLLEAEEFLDETSDYSDSLASSTVSLSDSIKEHIYENGRQYHRKSESRYLLPTDETELDRLDMTHHMMNVMLQGELYLAPWVPEKNSPHHVLDCGTGTGIWALDFADMHPASQVVGVDLAPIQTEWVYPNVKFELDDLEKEWTFKKNYFSYIHSRMIGTSIKDWKYYTQQMFDHCEPGGYVELSEYQLTGVGCDDNTVPADSGLRTYMSVLGEGLSKMGVNVKDYNAAFFQTHLENAGFVDVEVYTFKVPWGWWPKDKNKKYLGRVTAEVCSTGAEAHGLALMTRVLGYTEDDARKICDGFNKVVAEGKQHGYHLHWVLVGRKPKANEA
ncbi:S-adenosyl-L-methionine-dependent methyltransferase [Ascodesmis nigricans]|uniref:S-adenosyl-L-methionine-dependent methyltransferase n=1 Tax=Ascodesmis nigricans TaxID=341454 RepID=A0A4S2MKH1_9PEZI|nr:S-adenosyl-L-methionine-dependent methyltransferase [Ascodesmis nigricans]